MTVLGQITPGDVFEVKTALGLAYCQYTHLHRRFGELLRALPGLYSEEPNLSNLIESPTLFKIFYPLRAAAKKGLVKRVGTFPIPKRDIAFPLFRVRSLPNPNTMKVEDWSLWDGTTQWPIGRLRRKDRQLPIRGIANHAMLVHYLETQWRAEEVV